MIVDRARRYFKSWDIFTTAEFMRYKDETTKATYTGALISIAIYGIMLYLVIT